MVREKVVCSFSSDRSYTGFFLKDAEEDGSAKASANLSSDKPACLSGPSSSLMAEVLTEFIERMKTMEQKDATFDRYLDTILDLFIS